MKMAQMVDDVLGVNGGRLGVAPLPPTQFGDSFILSTQSFLVNYN